MARWMAGSLARGVTVATYRSVLVTWLRAQTATPASGASTQPITISSTATIVRHRCRRARPVPAASAASAPSAAAPGWRACPPRAAPRVPALHRQGGALLAEPLQLRPLLVVQAISSVHGGSFAHRRRPVLIPFGGLRGQPHPAWRGWRDPHPAFLGPLGQ